MVYPKKVMAANAIRRIHIRHNGVEAAMAADIARMLDDKYATSLGQK